jgi:hypothetical protein
VHLSVSSGQAEIGISLVKVWQEGWKPNFLFEPILTKKFVKFCSNEGGLKITFLEAVINC